ncbi:MAG TPA: PQQ-dependent sugar dehydrogenase [Solirubrobacterales bacterium]|nr:PQQ-dependent sugar dehydrogenase [Solirubrobacterales bacterium]
MRSPGNAWRRVLVGSCVVVASLWWSGIAAATPPATPQIIEPSSDGQVLNPADVHMEITGFSDPDGDQHACSDWQIWVASPAEVVWEADCATETEKIHIHLGDGHFVNSHAGQSALDFGTDYELRVRTRDDAGELSPWASRPFQTSAAGPSGEPGPLPWAVKRPNFKIEIAATGFQLPVNVATTPPIVEEAGGPIAYVAELYGTIKAVTRDGSVSDYASGLLNFDPTGVFPGSGEMGLTGLVVDPASGDVFAAMVYEDTSWPTDPKPHYAKVVRFHSHDGGLVAGGQETVLDMAGDRQGASRQISNLSIGPDGYLYVHNGDGGVLSSAQNLDDWRGKILRMTLGGEPVPTNPFYDPGDGIGARDYVYAYGFRNPFGGAWRAANGSHYEVENGPAVDRLARVDPGVNYCWVADPADPLCAWTTRDDIMRHYALYAWEPAHAPVNIAFVQRETANGSGFPETMMDHAFVTESGSTYAAGPQARGKRIVEFSPGQEGELAAEPSVLAEYTGSGRATAAGLAAGSDGLYFTDLYKDEGASSAIERGANLLRVRYVAPRDDGLVTDLQPRAGTPLGSGSEIGSHPPRSTGGRGLAVVARVVKVREGETLLRIRCAGNHRCHGTIALVAQRLLLDRRGIRNVRAIIGRGRFSIAPQRKSTVRIGLSPRGGQLLQRAGKHGLRVRIEGSGVKTRALTLRSGQW